MLVDERSIRHGVGSMKVVCMCVLGGTVAESQRQGDAQKYNHGWAVIFALFLRAGSRRNFHSPKRGIRPPSPTRY